MNDFLSDRQAQAPTTQGAGKGFFHAIEAFKQKGQVL
jgi:hypothetical protein